MSLLLETSAGDLVIDLLTSEAPKTSLNFLKLCKAKYYNFTPIYNLQSPSFFQSGDPNYPNGDGGSSCWGLRDASKRYYAAEQSRRVHERGSVSMVTSSAGLCGSQFFVSLGPNESFDKKHIVFGRLAEGFETLEVIESQPVDQQFRPLRDILIKHAIILEDPFDDPEGFIEPPESPVPTAAQLETVRIAFDEDIEEIGDEDTLDRKRREREAEASALALEAMGDLPFAAVRPPENILFVCKLNPVTSSDDLELIFGRFGEILSCQVVRDGRTGDSLQYAFIEFNVKEDAERAYFKMQGVLIDDRRIHVDFSQSVAKAAPKREYSRNSNRHSGDSNSRYRDDRNGHSHSSRRERRDRESSYDEHTSRSSTKYDSRSSRDYERSSHRSSRYSKSPDRSRRRNASHSRDRRDRDKYRDRDRHDKSDRDARSDRRRRSRSRDYRR